MPLMYIGVEGVKEMGYNACSMMIFSMAMFVREMITRNCSIKGQLHRSRVYIKNVSLICLVYIIIPEKVDAHFNLALFLVTLVDVLI